MAFDLAKLKTRWYQWQVDHPNLAHLVVIIESAAVGAALDLFMNGVDFSKDGLKHAATIIGTTVVVAVRNYIKDNVKTIKIQIDAQKTEPK
jgi:hypothetical protein